MRRCDLLIVCALPLLANAQQAPWTSMVPLVDSSGYWSIVLPPEFVARSREDLGDVRLLDHDGKEVPYILEAEPRLREEVREVPFTLLRNEVVKNASTTVEVDVGSDRVLNELRLRVRKARASKPMHLTGSDDRAHWYLVQDGMLHLGDGSGNGGSEMRIVGIPDSRYRYYRIALIDSTTAPVQVLDVGHVARIASEGRYVKYSALRFEQLGEGANTRVRLWADHPLFLERLTYAVSDTVRYMRNAHISVKQRVERKRGRGNRRVADAMEERAVDYARFSSHDGRTLDIRPVRYDSLSLIVENGDDRPLSFTKFDAWQLERRLVARLEKGASYRITTGLRSRSAPRYDMVHFRDSLPDQRPLLVAGPLTLIGSGALEEEAPMSSAWVWVGIAMLMALMAWSAWRMLSKKGDVNN